jgi:hypothetical protein
MPKTTKGKLAQWLGPEQWLPRIGLAAAGAATLAVGGVLAGWRDVLSSLLLTKIEPQLLLDTVWLLLLGLLLMALSWWFYGRSVRHREALPDHPSPVVQPSQSNLSPSERDLLDFLYVNHGTSYAKSELVRCLQVSEADVSSDLDALVKKRLISPPRKHLWDGKGPQPDGYHITNAGVSEAKK